MSQPANDDFSQHLSDDEASYHEDASDNGTATNKPKQQQQQLIPTTTTISNIKLPILKKEEYDIWAMEMEHYLEYIDNDVWKVIQNGNSKKRISTGKDGVIRVLPPVSAAEIHAVEKERKARTILLMAIPKEHLRRFHGMDDAKEIWEAIRTRFGGNANSKKMQKAVLKQQFEAFTISSSEGLEKGYDRFQQLLSQLEAHGAEVSTEDANHKFLRSLPLAWSNLAMTMRTKPDVDTLSIDDLYNNLRVNEDTAYLCLHSPKTTKETRSIRRIQRRRICRIQDIILDSRGAIPSKTAADAKVAIQEMAKYSQKWHNGTSRTRSTETSDGLAAIQAQLNNLGREIKKVNEKVYAAQVGWRYRAAALRFYQRNNANPSYQERRQFMKDTLSKFMSESAKRHEENSNMIKEIRASTDAVIRNQGASIKTLEIQIGQMSKVLQERGFGSLPSSTKANPRDQVKSISTTVEADSYSICRMGSTQYAVTTGRNRTLMYETKQTTILFPASRINNSIPRKEKDLGSFTLPCFINNVCFDNAIADLGASVSVMPLSTYINLGLGELAHTKITVELADRTMKYPKGIAKNVLVGIGKFAFLVDFIILAMPEDIKVPLILERPFLSIARAKIDVFKRKITLRVGEERIIFKSVKPASSLIKRVYMLSLRERMELDLEARLMGDTLALNKSLDHLNRDYIELNDLNEPLELRRDQGDDLMPTIKEGEVIEEFKTRDDELDTGIDDYPNFAVLKDMDAYRGEGMGDVIIGEPFLKEIRSKARRFDGMITIYNGNNEVSEEDKKKEISHPYQKLKGFYRGAFNLGPDYIRDAKTKEWLARGHVSVHEMEW
ncbi:mitochondrial proton/calcium exchanger protein-like protein isoform X1 [Tanacetum coccineum]